MNTALVIFNGIKFPYYLADRAIQWAVANAATLHALFLHADEDPEEGYLFPSDLDLAENITDKEDAAKDNMQIIEGYIKLLEDMAKAKGVPLKAEILTDPSLEEMLHFSRTAARIFIDATADQDAIFATRSFHMDDLIKQSTSPVEIVYG